MATKKPKQTNNTPASGMDSVVKSLEEAGYTVTIHEYAHGYKDVLWVDAEGTRQRREFRPDGTEIKRDSYDREVS